MKKKIILISIMLTLFTTGCKVIDTGEELTQPPKLEGEKQAIKIALKEYLPQNTKPIIPPSEDKGSNIKLVDLDGDGVEEAIIFYSIELEENPIRILVLRKEKTKKEELKWINKAEIKVIGQDLDRVSFKDLDGSGGSEIIIGSKIKYSFEKDINIYSMHAGEVENIFENKYDDILIEDLNVDEQTEILLLRSDKETGESFGALYKHTDGKMKNIDKISFNDRASINYVKYGNIYQDEKGIIISTTAQEDLIDIYLLKVQNDKLINVIKNGLIQAKKYSNSRILEPRDVDNVMEFALPSDIQGGSEEKLINWVTKWYSFDGANGITLKRLNYYDKKLNFTFELPLDWNDKMTITNLTRNENTIREEEYIKLEYQEKPDSRPIELFTVHIYNKDKLKRLDYKKITENTKEVLEDQDNKYYLKKNEKIDSDNRGDIYYKVRDIEKSFKIIED